MPQIPQAPLPVSQPRPEAGSVVIYDIHADSAEADVARSVSAEAGVARSDSVAPGANLQQQQWQVMPLMLTQRKLTCFRKQHVFRCVLDMHLMYLHSVLPLQFFPSIQFCCLKPTTLCTKSITKSCEASDVQDFGHKMLSWTL